MRPKSFKAIANVHNTWERDPGAPCVRDIPSTYGPSKSAPLTIALVKASI